MKPTTFLHSTVLVLLLILGIASQTLIAQPFAGGTGTENDPYQVATAAQLDSVRHFPSAYFIQTANINLGVSPYKDGDGWVPIPEFTGSYDGGGNIISGITINGGSSGNRGLFAHIDSASVSNLTLSGVTMAAATNTGILAGSVSNSRITGIRISGGNLSGTGTNMGGLLGISSSDTLSDISITGIALLFTSGANLGGLVGNASSIIISKVKITDASLSAQTDAGGLVGNLNSGSSISESEVTGGFVAGDLTGGLVARMSTSTITNSFSTIQVIGSAIASGAVAYVSGGSITNSYATGVVSGSNPTGLAGLVENGGTITNSYYNTDSTPEGNGNGTGLNSVQMRQRASFSGWDFVQTWFIEEGVGYPQLQEQRGNELIITGNEGWRMLASPLSARSVGRLLDPLWTQGFTGADAATGPSNLYFWDEPTRTWIVPGDTSFTPSNGTGFLMYVYSDDNADGTPEGFPKRLNQAGTPFSGQRSLDLSYTSSGNSADDGWNLVGNPYPSSINWNAGSGWSRQNMDETLYIWSDSANGGSGAYLSWNMSGVGTKGDGKIAPWQAFWVKATGVNPGITFTDTVRSSGGTLLKQSPTVIPQLKLEVTGSAGSSKTVLMFHKDASEDKDAFDAYKLQSLSQNYLLLGTSMNDGQVMDIQALPHPEELTELELILEGSDLSGEFTLNWEPEDIPEGWTAELIDTQTGESFSLADTASYTFSLNKAKTASKEKELKKKIGIPTSPIIPVTKTAPARFVIRLRLAVSNEPSEDLPTKVELQQNYPNPFNPSTTIGFGLPEMGEVTLEVFDVLGRKVATLLDGERKTAGRYTLRFDASRLASGMYIYRLQNGNKVITKKLTLIK